MDRELTYTLITGGSRGIGYAFARECAGRGMNLLLVAKPGHRLEEAAKKLQEESTVRINSLSVDLRDSDAPQKVWEWCDGNGYRVNILVNNAGMAGSSIFETSEPEYSDDRIMLNIRALVLLTRFFLPEIKTHEQGYILNVGSLSAYYPIAFKSVYAASKVFVHSFSRALREELRGSSVSVSVIHPNGVRTNEGTHTRINTHSELVQKLFINDADEIARLGITGMLKKKPVIIPGIFNRLLVFITRFLPPGYRDRRTSAIFRRELINQKK